MVNKSMFDACRNTVAVIVVSLLFGLSSAHAQDWKATGHFGWFGIGKAFQIEEGHFYWVGEFSGTFFSDKGEGGLFHLAGIKCPAWYDLDVNKGTTAAGGYCIVTDIEGDQAYLTWNNTGTAGPGGRGPGTFEYTGGTGKYAGISGKNRFVGITQVNWADGTTSGYATWNR
ncbi:MAG: hypothetical protein JSW48_05935 [Betaproteobacteria bacterium]|nr:MAG: hypothetical protein JSW48_05935 [Betaproteobacteria bacterium]